MPGSRTLSTNRYIMIDLVSSTPVLSLSRSRLIFLTFSFLLRKEIYKHTHTHICVPLSWVNQCTVHTFLHLYFQWIIHLGSTPEQCVKTWLIPSSAERCCIIPHYIQPVLSWWTFELLPDVWLCKKKMPWLALCICLSVFYAHESLPLIPGGWIAGFKGNVHTAFLSKEMSHSLYRCSTIFPSDQQLVGMPVSQSRQKRRSHTFGS